MGRAYRPEIVLKLIQNLLAAGHFAEAFAPRHQTRSDCHSRSTPAPA
jgi:hypothetical protein